MSRCSNCECDLPDLQSICKKCYDEAYAEIGQPKRPKSFRESLTRHNLLVFLGVFIFGFLYSRMRQYLSLYKMSTEASVLAALVIASIAFYVESRKSR
jgi:hypothetical protein